MQKQRSKLHSVLGVKKGSKRGPSSSNRPAPLRAGATGRLPLTWRVNPSSPHQGHHQWISPPPRKLILLAGVRTISDVLKKGQRILAPQAPPGPLFSRLVTKKTTFFVSRHRKRPLFSCLLTKKTTFSVSRDEKYHFSRVS